MKAFLIGRDGEHVEAAPRPRGRELSPSTFREEELEDMVGGYIEVLSISDEVSMVVDVNRDYKDTFLNHEATRLVRMGNEKAEPIMGPALVCLSDML